MKFRTAYSPCQAMPCPSGSRYRTTYTKSYEKDGMPRLIEVGKEDVYDSIQKAANGILLEDLIRRARSGDDSAIPEPVDSYADIADMPTDILSAHQMLSGAKDKFLRLPADIRASFGNSFESFLAAASDGSLVTKLTQPNKTENVNQLTDEELTQVRNMIGGNANA